MCRLSNYCSLSMWNGADVVGISWYVSWFLATYQPTIRCDAAFNKSKLNDAYTWIIVGMGSANDRQRYIGWAHTLYDLWCIFQHYLLRDVQIKISNQRIVKKLHAMVCTVNGAMPAYWIHKTYTKLSLSKSFVIVIVWWDHAIIISSKI